MGLKLTLFNEAAASSSSIGSALIQMTINLGYELKIMQQYLFLFFSFLFSSVIENANPKVFFFFRRTKNCYNSKLPLTWVIS